MRQERGWKLFVLLPRLLLFRPARRGLISKKKLEERFADFVRREWLSLLEGQQEMCGDGGHMAKTSATRERGQNNVEKRAARAHTIVQLGELSSARQTLEGADLALGNDATSRALCRRPARPQEPIPDRTGASEAPTIRSGREVVGEELEVGKAWSMCVRCWTLNVTGICCRRFVSSWPVRKFPSPSSTPSGRAG